VRSTESKALRFFVYARHPERSEGPLYLSLLVSFVVILSEARNPRILPLSLPLPLSLLVLVRHSGEARISVFVFAVALARKAPTARPIPA
jgi:hypothetical protein